MEKLKILEICNFSAGISGVWARTFGESKHLAEKYDVHVFSSDLENGKTTPKKEEIIDGIKIKRFPVKRKIGYAVFFDFGKEAFRLKPDLIITHGFRKPYLNKAIKISKKLKIPCFLVTHAPFVEKKLRSQKINFLVKLYDKIYAKKILNSFNKIIAITKWEIPQLLKLGARKEKIVLIPNGIPEQFFKQKKIKPTKNKILFLGRIDPIKNLETLIKALSKIKAKCELDITGPGNEIYIQKLKNLSERLKVNVKFNLPLYDLTKKIKKIDSAEIFVLPSRREGFPISLIEAMAREKVTISSFLPGMKEAVKNEENGFLFNPNNEQELADKISFCLDKKNPKILNKIKTNAKKSVQKFSWDSIIKEIENLIKQALS